MLYDDEIQKEFLKLLDIYLEIHYVIELTKPHFNSEMGRKLIDDLLHVASFYGRIGERLMEANEDVLQSTEALELMGVKIGELCDRVENIPWSETIKSYNEAIRSSFDNYVTEAAISSSDKKREAAFEGREWFIRHSGENVRELFCRNSGTKELNGAYIRWQPGAVEQICYMVNESPVIKIDIGLNGYMRTYRSDEPVELDVKPESDKISESDPGWKMVLAGTAGALLISSLFSNKKASTGLKNKMVNNRVAKHI